MTLVIMAAGMGSRYGGLKQIDPVGRNGEFILDFSIYDAIQAGFDHVVFIIKEENYEIFQFFRNFFAQFRQNPEIFDGICLHNKTKSAPKSCTAQILPDIYFFR